MSEPIDLSEVPMRDLMLEYVKRECGQRGHLPAIDVMTFTNPVPIYISCDCGTVRWSPQEVSK